MEMTCSSISRSRLSIGAVGLHDLLGQLRVAAFQRVERLTEKLLGEAAHLGDLLVEQRQLFLV